jgi:hypothetical protein
MPEMQSIPTGVLLSRAQEREQATHHEEQAKLIISQMEEARQTIEGSVLRLASLAQQLRTHALRRRDDLTTGYLSFSSAYTRICGALNSGLRRTASMSRILDQAKMAQEETERREQREASARQARAQAKEIERLSLPTSDDFDLVYGTGAEAE